ncbi:L-asparaginase [Habropoda laboriosa]|uniref:L-asparaginase n=1 Tax=Habropoda laboriosa TaxID=597456 RepID=A0A0L7QKU2_9HYME|nr:L-asparaginase [Habropoda laboriosa]
MQKCRVCGNADFYKEAGYFFCITCQTQNEDIREEILELRVDNSTKLRKTKIKKLGSSKSGEELGWTSWELYNFVLIGLTNELIELGVPPDIKLTVLQLWTTYLGKVEVAFISTKKKYMPKLARRYKKRDAEIIYGKVQSQKRIRKRRRTGSSINTSLISGGPSEGSSKRELNRNKRLLASADYNKYLQSQGSFEGDGLSLFSQSVYSVQSSSVKSSDNEGRVKFSSHAKEEAKKINRLSKNVPRFERVKYKAKHITTQYKIGPHMITPMRLWAIIYLALRIRNHPIQLGDIIFLFRYGKEGHLSYYKLDHLLPPEISISASERKFLTQNVEITHKGMRRIIASIAKLLGVWDIICPDFSSLVCRYCQELGLPRGIQMYAERLIALSPPKLTFDAKKSYIPNYEGRAIAFIIVVLKTLFALDDITECQISRIAEKINRFSFFCKKMYRENIKMLKKFGEGECKCYESNVPCIIVHGGAGNFSNSIVIEKMTACKKAAINGYKKLVNGETSVDAVEAALWWLECDEFFNCSYGSVLNEAGKVEMDASIMDGFTFKCGSVAAVSDIEHPITLAKYVLNNFPNSIFVGDGAKNLAKHANLNWISEGNMVAPIARLAFDPEEEGKSDAIVDNQSLLDIDTLTNNLGTVGCVAYDGYSIAAGTTTGGLNKKLVGRVGDSSILGCGTYATRNVGCSLTGHGESIIKLGLARAIVEDIEHNLSNEEALHKHFSHMLKEFEQNGGGIVLQSDGRWAAYFTSDKMPYAVIENDLITYGARLYEEKREMYNGDGIIGECKCPL